MTMANVKTKKYTVKVTTIQRSEVYAASPEEAVVVARLIHHGRGRMEIQHEVDEGWDIIVDPTEDP